DVTDIILNLKQLSLRMHCDEPRVLRLHAEGEGEVKAGDIHTDADVEILNPDLHIATLDKGGRLIAEITVGKGRGYVPADQNKTPDMPIGVIPVDSIFSPIRRVNYTIEHTRVGNKTNFDKLTLEVWTNGAVRPDEACSWAAKILKEHLELFIGLTEDADEIEVMQEKEDDERNKLMEMTIEELD